MGGRLSEQRLSQDAATVGPSSSFAAASLAKAACIEPTTFRAVSRASGSRSFSRSAATFRSADIPNSFIASMSILEVQWEMATAALALTLRLAWWTYALSFLSRGRGGIDAAIARIAFSASSHTNRLSWDAFSRSWSSSLSNASSEADERRLPKELKMSVQAMMDVFNTALRGLFIVFTIASITFSRIGFRREEWWIVRRRASLSASQVLTQSLESSSATKPAALALGLVAASNSSDGMYSTACSPAAAVALGAEFSSFFLFLPLPGEAARTVGAAATLGTFLGRSSTTAGNVLSIARRAMGYCCWSSSPAAAELGGVSLVLVDGDEDAKRGLRLMD
uniref:Uncharacterized protein n=1 Tax=Arundo donax TaxID=35708 RepID=A0A0A8XS08_ARUDO